MDRDFDLSEKLFQHKILEFGRFRLKSGTLSSFYFNFRKLWVHPELFKTLITAIDSKFDGLWNQSKYCPVLVPLPYAGIPLASYLSSTCNRPMILLRKESKKHGSHTQSPKYLEDVNFLEPIVKQKPLSLILIDDVISTGQTIQESLENVKREFQEMGYQIHEIHLLVILSRSSKAIKKIQAMGIKVHVFMSINDIFFNLYKLGLIQDRILNKLMGEFKDLAATFAFKKVLQRWQKKINDQPRTNRVQGLLKQAIEKKSPLCLSWDHDSLDPLIALIPSIAPFIVLIKLHEDIYKHADKQEKLKKIYQLSQRNKIFLMEDRKLSDIGFTVEKQVLNLWNQNPHFIDFVTIQNIAGASIWKAFESLEKKNKIHPSPVVIESMSTQGNLCNADYIANTRRCMETFRQIVGGRVTQNPEENGKFVNFTPGVNPVLQSDDMGQRYGSLNYALYGLLTDFVIMGRGLMYPEKKEGKALWTAIPEPSDSNFAAYQSDMLTWIKKLLQEIYL